MASNMSATASAFVPGAGVVFSAPQKSHAVQKGQDSQAKRGVAAKNNTGRGVAAKGGPGGGRGKGGRGRGGGGRAGSADRRRNVKGCGGRGKMTRKASKESPGSGPRASPANSPASDFGSSTPNNGGRGGGRKGQQSANHLLGFRLAEREQMPADSRPLHQRRTCTMRSLKKQGFLHSSTEVRFAISKATDTNLLSQILSDPDRAVQWESIEQVLFQLRSPYRCPICLEKPCAPRTTKCGHVFCYPCIVQYLSYGDDTGRKCPMCFEMVSIDDLKPAVMQQVTPILAGKRLDLVLLHKPHGVASIFPRLYDRSSADNSSRGAEGGSSDTPPTASTTVGRMSVIPRQGESSAAYAKFCLSDEIAALYRAERTQLEQGLKQAIEWGEEHTVPFFALCLHLLSTAEQSVARLAPREAGPAQTPATATPASPRVAWPAPAPAAAQPHVQEKTGQASHSKPSVVESVWFDNENDEAGKAVAEAEAETEPEEPIPAQTVTSQQQQPSLQHQVAFKTDGAMGAATATPSFFFQAKDGQPAFLHPLELRCLLEENQGAPWRLPALLEGIKLAQAEKHVQSLELRKRFKSCAHLPLLSEFWVLEIELGELKSKGLVSAPIDAKFAEMFSVRSEKRRHALRAAKRKEEKYEAQVARSSLREAQSMPAHMSQIYNARGDELFENDEFFLPASAPAAAGGSDGSEGEDGGGGSSYSRTLKTHTVHQDTIEVSYHLVNLPCRPTGAASPLGHLWSHRRTY